nr:MAG TPA: hypothetical protein [Microviridae sp.]
MSLVPLVVRFFNWFSKQVRTAEGCGHPRSG